MKTNNKKKSLKKVDFNALRPLGMLSHFGLIIILPLIAGVALGSWLDDKLGTRPLMLIVFLILFLISAMMNVYTTAMRLAEKKKEAPKPYIEKNGLITRNELAKKQEAADNDKRGGMDYDGRD